MAYMVKQGIKYEIETKYYRDGLNLQKTPKKEMTENLLEVYHIKKANDTEIFREDFEDKRSTPEKMKCNSFDKDKWTTNIEVNMQLFTNKIEDQNELENKDRLCDNLLSLPKIKDSMKRLPVLKEKSRLRKKCSHSYEIKDAVDLLREIQKDFRSKNELYDIEESRDKNRYLSKIQDQINNFPKRKNKNHQEELYEKDEESWIQYHCLSSIQDLINYFRKIKNIAHQDELHDKGESKEAYSCLSKIQDLVDLFLKLKNRDHQKKLCCHISKNCTMNFNKGIKIESNKDSLCYRRIDESRILSCF